MTVHVDVPWLKAPEQYRRLAKEAIHKAETAPSPYFRLSYLGLAAGWRALAKEAEKTFDDCVHAEAESVRNLWAEHRAD